jgi:hypothetical protein
MTLGSTQPLVKMSTRNIPEGKGGRCVRLTTLPPSHAECHEIGEPKPPETVWPTPGLLRDSFTFTFFYCICYHSGMCRIHVCFTVADNSSVVLNSHMWGDERLHGRAFSKIGPSCKFGCSQFVSPATPLLSTQATV